MRILPYLFREECNCPPSPWPSPPGEGNTFARLQKFERKLDQSSAWFANEAENDSPSPGGEGRGEGGHYSISFIVLLIAALTWNFRASGADVPATPCRIEVVEKASGWPVPLVELRTTHNVRLVSDNAGVIAFDLPELMGRETWFEVHGQGYEVPKDGFGMRGVRVTP